MSFELIIPERRKPEFWKRPDYSHPQLRGLVGWWLFREGGGDKAWDLSHSRMNATFNNDASWIIGRNGPAVNFDGTGDYLNPGMIHDADNDRFTVSAWMRTTTLTSDQCIFGNNTGSAGWNFLFEGGDSGDPLKVTFSGVASQVSSATGIQTGVWYHVAVTYDKSTMDFYVDGVLLSSHAFTHAVNVTAIDQYIGSRNNNGTADKNFNGDLDDVRVFDRALRPIEIRETRSLPYVSFDRKIYIPTTQQAAAPATDTSIHCITIKQDRKPDVGRLPNRNHAQQRGLWGEWPFNEGGGTTVRDASLSRNNGTLQSGVSWSRGKWGPATDHDGSSNGYIDCGTGLGNRFGNSITNISYTCWIKADTTTSNDGVIYIGDHASSHGEIQLAITGNELRFFMDAAAFDRSISFSDTTNWNHVAFTYDGVTGRCYLNGVQGSSAAYTSGLNLSGLKTILGGYFAAANSFDGMLDDPRIYNRALTVTEVRNTMVRPWAAWDQTVYLPAGAEAAAPSAGFPFRRYYQQGVAL